MSVMVLLDVAERLKLHGTWLFILWYAALTITWLEAYTKDQNFKVKQCFKVPQSVRTTSISVVGWLHPASICIPLNLLKTIITAVSAAHLLPLHLSISLPFLFIFLPLLSWLSHVCCWVHMRLLIVSCLLCGFVATCFYVLQNFSSTTNFCLFWSIICPCTLSCGSLVIKCALTK